MKRILIFVLLLITILTKSNAQIIRSISPTWIDQVKSRKTDTTYVIHFWATWCKPCIGELPQFEKMYNKYRKQKIKIFLVSTDMKKDKDSILQDFIRKNNIHAEVLWMNEINANIWINRVNEEWSGAIPATLIIQNKRHLKSFHEGTMDESELDITLESFIE